ncbi:hypothetical protein RFI_32174 [Reticulomyxa filosa]|uniref:TRAF-type domain-containing protein n=1 Tax=Reticulomyxa filosa TaxID=46433 RepID=X6LVP2_RETFI|nr:hypothetical protein RFI_32174 [Reticulomyxa filosa]|eukprot:ETO05222.1 hypothetical protein RFI_32174 [Reticulomyxa filosa]
MELTCNEHEDRKDTPIVGKKCLMKYLNENNNKCPIDKHGRTLRNIVSELKVICLRQFINHFNEKTDDRTKEGDTITETKHVCKFKGKIEEMKEHLKNKCPLKPLECKFKEFECKEQGNETQLLKSNKDLQIETLLKQKQQWDEKEEEMKKLQK